MPKSRIYLLAMVVFIVIAFIAVAMWPDIAETKPSNSKVAAQIKTLEKEAHKSQSAIRFWKDQDRGRWMLHLRHDKCKDVHGKQRRILCKGARRSLGLHSARLARLGRRLERLTEPLWCRGQTSNRVLGCKMAYEVWPSKAEWDALEELWDNESHWNQYAKNPSGACGIPQAMNSCSYGYNPVDQIRWGLNYIRGRYHSPRGALSAFYSRSPTWY